MAEGAGLKNRHGAAEISPENSANADSGRLERALASALVSDRRLADYWDTLDDAARAGVLDGVAAKAIRLIAAAVPW